MKLAEIILGVLAASAALNAFLLARNKANKRQKQKLERENQEKQQVIQDVKQRKEIAHDAYGLDADELDKRLQQDYRD